jgi:hypothetical protein
MSGDAVGGRGGSCAKPGEARVTSPLCHMREAQAHDAGPSLSNQLSEDKCCRARIVRWSAFTGLAAWPKRRCPQLS